MGVVDIVDKILLLVDPDPAGQHIMHMVFADQDVVQVAVSGGTARHGHIDAGIPVHALIYIPVPPVLPLYVKNLTVLDHDPLRDPLRLSADADSLSDTAFFCPVGHGDIPDLPEAHAFQQDSRVRAVPMDDGSRFFILSFLPVRIHRYRVFPASGAFGTEHSMPAPSPFQTQGVSRLIFLRVRPLQGSPGRIRAQARAGIVAVYAVKIKTSFWIPVLIHHDLPFHCFFFLRRDRYACRAVPPARQVNPVSNSTLPAFSAASSFVAGQNL